MYKKYSLNARKGAFDADLHGFMDTQETLNPIFDATQEWKTLAMFAHRQAIQQVGNNEMK